MIIYKLISPSGKVYIGQTKQKFEKRLQSHLSKSKSSNLYLYKSIRKYGWDNFIKEVVLDKIAEDKIDDLERQYIKELNTLAPNGYNLESGGNKNKHLSEEHRNKISKALKYNHPFKGLNFSLEFRKKLSNVRKDKKIVLCFDKQNKFIKEYNSICEASRETNIDKSDIFRVCKNIRKSAGNYIWKFKGEKECQVQ